MQFVNGSLTDITFADSRGSTPNRFALQSTSGYAFLYNNELSAAYGSIAATPAIAATPEPSSLALLGTGVLGVAGVIRRRFATV